MQLNLKETRKRVRNHVTELGILLTDWIRNFQKYNLIQAVEKAEQIQHHQKQIRLLHTEAKQYFEFKEQEYKEAQELFAELERAILIDA